LDEHGEREMIAVRLLRYGSSQISYLVAHRRESSAWFGIRRVLSESLPGSSHPLSWMPWWKFAFVHIVKLFSALTSEIRRVTGDDRDRHLIRPLNATLHGSICPGSRFAVV